MKTLFGFLAFGMLLFAGCAKDDVFNESLEGFELNDANKRANVPIPFKAEMCAAPDMESEFYLFPIPGIDPSDPDNYCASRMLISGTGTHLGRVYPETSYYEVGSTVFLVESSHPYLNQSGTGKMVAANGDSFEVTWWAKISLPDRNWVGEFEVITGSGTGKFEGMSGVFESVGQANMEEHLNCWTSEGYMQYN